MRLLYRISILFLLISCALIFGSIGRMNDMGFFLLLCILFEGAFWFGTVQGYAAPRESLATQAEAKVGSHIA